MNFRQSFRRAALAIAIAQPVFAAQPSAADEFLAKSPVIDILMDASEGAPSTNGAFLQMIWPSIEQKLRSMPMGSTVIVSSIGDSKSMPKIWRTRIQAKSTIDGAPLDAVIRGVKRVVLTFPELIKGKEDKQSHLVQGVFEASRNMNPESNENVLLLISDLIEYDPPRTNCLPPRPCKLPAPNFSLKNVDVHVFGSADRLPPKQAMTILSAWQDFFKKAGVDLRLMKTM